MAVRPLRASLWRKVAVWLLAASVLVGVARPAVAADPQVAAAWQAYYGGKAIGARQGLETHLASAEAADPARRLAALEALLEICIRSLDDDCLVAHAGDYAAAAGSTLGENPVHRLEAARRAGYYLYSAQLARGTPEQLAAILQSGNWKTEPAYDVELYLRRQVLATHILLRLGRPLEANRRVDKILSLIAAAKTPRDAAPTIVWALSESMEALIAIGDTQRAHGLLRASLGGVSRAAPPLSVEAVLYELRAAKGSLAVDRGGDARRFLELAVRTLDVIELAPAARRRLLVEALTETAATCAVQGDAACARAALARHPFATVYLEPGRAAASVEEVRYLAVRAIAAGLAQETDPVAVQALQATRSFVADPGDQEILAAFRDVGVALARPPGPERAAGLRDAGRRLRTLARRPQQAPFGAWYRSSVLDQGLVRLALTQAGEPRDADGADTIFALLQLAGRRGQDFDADALAILGQARDEPQRRAVHQALRLRARRDALERAAIHRVADQLASGTASGQPVRQDFGMRLQFRDFADRIAAASDGLAQAGVATSGTNLATLKQLQAVLAPDEAVLTLAPSVGGLAYMCVRRDSELRRVAPTDLSPLRGDFKLLAAALTAGHPPSETLDAQFPVAAAVRLYDVLIRPFEPCLKSGDHILWLPSLAATGFPIQALLEKAPPRSGAGWDLAQAPWLARRHAVTYAGSASTIVALRTSRRPPPTFFDFLGVGDPRLDGVSPAGEDRASLAVRGARAGLGLAALAPLPETRDELERSAEGFVAPTLLTGEAATEAAVRRQATGAYRYLSFATHGLVRDELEGVAEPALVLTPVTGADAMNDGLLTAAEIADLNLAARFVALSACNTANVDVGILAQDLPALASAFAVAGTPATLGTLWPVDSETGRRVVAAAFQGLRSGQGASAALAGAQRAFLAEPPGRAWLHPRFWAPFVVMGDGGAPSAAAPEPPAVAVRAVEMLDGDGEVYAVRREGAGVLVHANGARTPAGAYTATTRLAGGWAHANPELSAAKLLAMIDGRWIVGGSRVLGPEQIRPGLEALDARTGAVAARWSGDQLPDPAAVLAGGAAIGGDRVVFGVATLPLPGQTGQPTPRLLVYATGAELTPRRLFDVDSPSRFGVDDVTFTRLGEDLLVTYSARAALPHPARAAIADEFDLPTCTEQSLTRLELRDLADGRLKASTELRGDLITAAYVGADGRVLLGGTRQAACGGERRAVVLAVDGQLGTRLLYADATLGASDVRALAGLPDGRIFVAASKDNTVDIRAPQASATGPGAVARLLYSGMVLILGPKGEASFPTYLNAATTVGLNTVDAAAPDDILVGGMIGDVPAIFHLSVAAGRARQR